MSFTLYNEDCLTTLKRLPDNSVNLAIIDPPYFNIKGEFDFKMTFLEWQDLHERLAQDLKRVLKYNGTILLYGHAKRIAYQQVIFDRLFNLENNLVWEKKDSQTKRADFTKSHCFAPITERMLMYSNEVSRTGLQKIYSNKDCFVSIKKYMRDERKRLMTEKGFRTVADFDRFINDWTNTKSVVSRHYFADSQYVFPTKEIYEKMQQTGFWKKSYEGLHKEYEELRRPFNNIHKLTDVLKFSQKSHITRKYDHPTQKSPKLTKALIEATSIKGDMIFIPFGGSGVEYEQALLLDRKVICAEISAKYCTTINDRVASLLQGV